MVERILEEGNKTMWKIMLDRADKLHQETIELREQVEETNRKWDEFLESHREFEQVLVAFKKYFDKVQSSAPSPQPNQKET